MDFPALDDSKFPNLSNVNVWEYRNEFNYSRWTPDTRLKLLRVPWDRTYKNAVAFADEAARDNWFDSAQGKSIELQSDFAKTPEGSVRVQIPRDEVARYNYLMIELPRFTPEGGAIDFEGDSGVRRLFYFIDDMIQRAPSTTELALTLDVWMTHIYSVEVASLYLERGHAPMYDIDADAFLANPRERCDGLLTPDVTFSDSSLVSGHVYKPLHMSDEKYIVFATTISPSALDALSAGTSTGSDTPPTYANRNTRSGYQEIVNGFEWSATGMSYDGAEIPATVTSSPDDAIATGLHLYATLYRDFNRLSGALAESYPHFIKSIQSAYILPRSLFSLGSRHALGALQLFKLVPVDSIEAGAFTLDKSMFNYPERYSSMAKLYTSPYAHLEFSDDFGASYSVRIEDTGASIDIVENVSACAPFLRWDVLLSNVDSGAAPASYSFKTLEGVNEQTIAYAGDFMSFAFKWDIPTYAIYLEAERLYALDNYARSENERDRAIVSYQNSARSANTGRENALDGNAMSKANTDASADTMVANNLNDTATMTANLDIANAAGTVNVTAGNTASYNINSENNQSIDDLLVADQNLQDALLEVDNDRMAQSTVASGIGGILEGVAEGALQGAGIGAAGGAVVGGVGALPGAAIGAIIGTAGALVGAVTSGMQNAVIANANATQLAANKTNQGYHAQYQERLNNNGTLVQIDLKTATNTRNVQASESQNANNVATSNTNAANNANTAKGNAARSKATGDANSTYTRETSIENAKASLELAQRSYETGFESAKVQKPVQIGGYSGDAVQDAFKRRGIHMRVKTQDRNSIARAGDYFRRFGYAYDGFYDFESWTKGEKVCYWKARDVELLPSKGASAYAIMMLAEIITNGVTVYSDPEFVGRF